MNFCVKIEDMLFIQIQINNFLKINIYINFKHKYDMTVIMLCQRANLFINIIKILKSNELIIN